MRIIAMLAKEETMEILEIDPNKKYIFNLQYANEQQAKNFKKLIKKLIDGPDQFITISCLSLEEIPPELFSSEED